jgi:uncharacterized protein YndB with AHSA1/START domain
MEIRHDVLILRPPEAVFDFLTDTDSFPVIDRALRSYTPRGRMSAGLAGTFVHRRGGMTARSTWYVAALVRPSHIHVAVRGAGYEMDETVELAPTDHGTRAAFIDRVRPTSLPGRLMVALSGAVMRRDLERRAALLKATLEPGAGPAAS